MKRSLNERLRELELFREEVIAGLYPQRTPLGPGAISRNLIKAKTVTANLLNVDELSSVATKTGALTVTGNITAGAASSSISISPTNGLYLGNTNPSLAPFRVDMAGNMNAQQATVKGNITADLLTANTAGTIGGWTIDSQKLSRDNVGIGASGTYRIWSGNLSSPSLANFSVDNMGSVRAAAGEVAGWTIDSSKLSRDSGAVGMGASGGIRIWAGDSSPALAPFRVDSSGGLVATSATVSGTINATSGSFTGSVTTSNLSASGGSISNLSISGTLTMGQYGKITWSSSDSYIDQNVIQVNSDNTNQQFKIVARIGSVLYQIGYLSGNRYFDSSTSTWITEFRVGSLGTDTRLRLFSGATYLYLDRTSVRLWREDTNGSYVGYEITSNWDAEIRLKDKAGASQFRVKDSDGVIRFGVGSNGDLMAAPGDTAAVGSYAGKIRIYVEGQPYWLAYYD